jgi:hypothetical protein
VVQRLLHYLPHRLRPPGTERSMAAMPLFERMVKPC